jgi:ubiquinone/menaquinone biosynthesis C-methylase UbiE
MSVSYRNFTGTAAENYERYFVPAIATPVSASLLRAADLQPGERVADVACGTGVIARLAATQVGATGAVTAVDLSPDMIEVARRTPKPTGAAIEWHVGDAESLPLDDESCDVVLCQMGLMFMADRAAALAEMRRVLVAGGRVAISTPGRIQRPFELMEEAIVEHLDPNLGGFVRAVFSMHDPDVVGGLLRDAGFRDVDTREETVELDLPDAASFLWQYINLSPMAPFVEPAPDDAKAAMEEQLVTTWEPFVVDGRTRFAQPMVVAHATT